MMPHPTLLLALALLGTDAAGVLPLRLPDQAAESPEVRAVQDDVYHAASRLARHLMARVHPWEGDASVSLITESRSGEHWIRPNTGFVQGLCFLSKFGPYDEQAVGVPRADLLPKTIVPMMRYLILTHVTGTKPTSDGKPWGDAWQSAHWAQMLGRGAWRVWGDLPADVQEGVRRVVAHEADRIASSTIPYQIKLDTKAEENAWNSQILDVAVLLLPSDARRPKWEEALSTWVMSSFLRPADAHDAAVVDGKAVSAWFGGANIHDDFTLENHRIVHPDYMTTFGLSLGQATDFAMSGRALPGVYQHNVAGIYENLKWFSLPDGGYVYPNGQDWELFRNPSWTFSHVLMATFGSDPDAWHLAKATMGTLKRMQARSTTGEVWLKDEFFFASTETDLLSGLARSWLLLQASPDIVDRPTQRLGVRRLDAGRVVLNRTPKALHTLSWGDPVMWQCAVYRPDRVVSPDFQSGVGAVRYEGQKEAAEPVVRESQIEATADGFEGRLVIDHGEKGLRAVVVVRSTADGRWTVSEELTATSDVVTEEIATGLVGVLNNARWVYEHGVRTISLDGRETAVKANSGREMAGKARAIQIDGVLRIRSEAPLAVRYEVATRPERGRSTDRLWLNHIPGRREWKAGEVVSRYEVMMDVVEP